MNESMSYKFRDYLVNIIQAYCYNKLLQKEYFSCTIYVSLTLTMSEITILTSISSMRDWLA